MSDSSPEVVRRDLNATDAIRIAVSLAMLLVVAVCYWFVLPSVQSLTIPDAPGGNNGPWVVKPIAVVRYLAVAMMTIGTVILIGLPLQKAWRRQDVVLGSRFDPLHDRPVMRGVLAIRIGFILVLYLLALLFYLFSWTFIGPEGIEIRVPWTTRHYSFQDIAALEKTFGAPPGDSKAPKGPRYTLSFKDGSSLTLSDDNVGMTRAELRAMTVFVAEKSNLAWKDVRAR